MSKIIVTHLSPDLDALASVWLIHRFKPRWKHADVQFVSAGRTLNDMKPDSDSQIIHVDTGLGKYDHHHTSALTCAARLVLDDLIAQEAIKENDREALERLVDVVTRYDHFQEVMLADPDDDMHVFSIAYMIFGHRINQGYAHRLVEITEECLDGIFQYMKNKVNAEKALTEGHEMKTYWGTSLILETDNDKAMKVAFTKGYDLVVRYSPHYKNVSIKVHPNSKKNLKKLYEKIIANDSEAQWFYHASGRMLLNASTKATKEKVTKYSLKEIMALIKSF